MTMRLSNSSFTGTARTRRGGRQLQRGVHVLGDRGGRAAQRDELRAAARRRPARRAALAAAAGFGRRPGLRAEPGRRGRRRPAARAAGAAAPAAAAAGAAGRGRGGRSRRGRVPRPRPRLRRGGGAGAARPRRPAPLRRGGRAAAVRLVVGEEVPPGSVYRVRVLEVLLVDLVDEPLVGAERRSGVLALPGLVGRDARVIGGLWRHGGNRPLPLHKVMDSGNKGYALRTPVAQARAGHRRVGHIGNRVSGAGYGGKQTRFRYVEALVECRLGARAAHGLGRHRVRSAGVVDRGSGSDFTSTSRRMLAREGDVDPAARSDSATSIRPPCRSTAQRAMARPRPVPPSLPGPWAPAPRRG